VSPPLTEYRRFRNGENDVLKRKNESTLYNALSVDDNHAGPNLIHKILFATQKEKGICVTDSEKVDRPFAELE
jgi:hypothetical protein